MTRTQHKGQIKVSFKIVHRIFPMKELWTLILYQFNLDVDHNRVEIRL